MRLNKSFSLQASNQERAHFLQQIINTFRSRDNRDSTPVHFHLDSWEQKEFVKKAIRRRIQDVDVALALWQVGIRTCQLDDLFNFEWNHCQCKELKSN